MICEPYYEGGILYDVIQALNDRSVSIRHFGLPHEFCRHYGTTVENMSFWNRTAGDLRSELEIFIK